MAMHMKKKTEMKNVKNMKDMLKSQNTISARMVWGGKYRIVVVCLRQKNG